MKTLFKSHSNDTEANVLVTESNSNNDSFMLINALSTVTGNIESTGDVVIDGIFNGTINARNLRITPSGKVKGMVNVTSADISGSLEPEIYCIDKLVIKETGQFTGKVFCKNLVVNLGGKFIGSIEEIK